MMPWAFGTPTPVRVYLVSRMIARCSVSARTFGTRHASSGRSRRPTPGRERWPPIRPVEQASLTTHRACLSFGVAADVQPDAETPFVVVEASDVHPRRVPLRRSQRGSVCRETENDEQRDDDARRIGARHANQEAVCLRSGVSLLIRTRVAVLGYLGRSTPKPCGERSAPGHPAPHERPTGSVWPVLP